jgi:hypothetical protein
MKKNQKTYLITEEDLFRLEKDSLILCALEGGGVDNWAWYSESIYDFAKDACNLREEDGEWSMEAIERTAKENIKKLYKEAKEDVNEKSINNNSFTNNIFL